MCAKFETESFPQLYFPFRLRKPEGYFFNKYFVNNPSSMPNFSGKNEEIFPTTAQHTPPLFPSF